MNLEKLEEEESISRSSTVQNLGHGHVPVKELPNPSPAKKEQKKKGIKDMVTSVEQTVSSHIPPP
jgi:hypothetical protein